MAIAIDTGVNASLVNPGTSLTYSHTCTGSDLILVVGVLVRNQTVSSVTYNGVAMTEAGTRVGPDASNDFVSIFTLVNPATGSNSVTITAAGSTVIMGSSVSYTGASQSGQPDAVQGNSPTTETTTTTTLTTIADNSWLINITRAQGDGVTSAGSGTFRRTNTAGQIQMYDSNGAKTPAGSFSLISTQASQPTMAQMISIAPAVAGPVNLKTVNGLASASVKTIDGLAIASIKSYNGLT